MKDDFKAVLQEALIALGLSILVFIAFVIYLILTA